MEGNALILDLQLLSKYWATTSRLYSQIFAQKTKTNNKMLQLRIHTASCKRWGTRPILLLSVGNYSLFFPLLSNCYCIPSTLTTRLCSISCTVKQQLHPTLWTPVVILIQPVIQPVCFPSLLNSLLEFLEQHQVYIRVTSCRKELPLNRIYQHSCI